MWKGVSGQDWQNADGNQQLTVRLLCVSGFRDGAAGHPAAIVYTQRLQQIYNTDYDTPWIKTFNI